jgi:hypothetical protein
MSLAARRPADPWLGYRPHDRLVAAAPNRAEVFVAVYVRG